MDASVTSAIIAGIGVILTGWLGFMGNKKSTLATAEQDFRKTVMEENKELRERLDKIESEHSTLMKEHTEVLIENRKLQLKIIELIGTNGNDSNEQHQTET